MAHCAHIPAFVLHQVTCQFATDRPSLVRSASRWNRPFAAWSAGTASARRVCCVCWRALILLPAAILSAPPPLPGSAAADAHAGDHPRYAAGLCVGFAALSRLEQGQGLADDFDLLDGHWDLTDRLSLAFREADLPPFSADRPAFSLSGGERMKVCCAAPSSRAPIICCWMSLPTIWTARGGVALSPTGKLAGRGSDRQPRPRAADADAEDY